MNADHSHQQVSPSASSDARYRDAVRVTVVGALANVVLAVLKLLAGFVGQSQALIADGIHSLSDLVSDAMVLYASKHGSRDADEEHPYGHGRIETLMTVVLGVFLLAIAIGILADAVRRLFQPELLLRPGVVVLAVAGLSVAVKEVLYHYTVRTARRNRAEILRANAWHHRSDAVSSIIVIIGAAGSMAGLEYLDAIAAGGVAFMIAKIAWDLSWSSVRELIDTALEADKVEGIRRTILSVSGVQALHMLRTRRMAGDALVDVHIQVDPKVSVSEGHQISENVRSRLLRDIEEVSDVVVHIDPEDDEVARPCSGLPEREEAVARLKTQWKDLIPPQAVDDVTLHYLDGKIHAEVRLTLSVAHDLEEARSLAEELAAAGEAVPEIGSVRVLFSSPHFSPGSRE